MTNNDVLRRIRYTFNLRDEKVIAIFSHVNEKVSEQQVQRWLKKDDDPDMEEITDIILAQFLNGFIIEKRGKRDGALPKAEKTLTKNLMLMKLKIALTLQNDDIIELLSSTGFTIGKSELTAFFRKPEHKNYRHCKSQFLRNFLQALQDKYRKPYTPKNKRENTESSEQETLRSSNTFHADKSHFPKGKKGSHNKSNHNSSAQNVEKKIYVNPNATGKPEKEKNTRKVLKLKPEDIYKNS